MADQITLKLPLNRVEGDLELKLHIQDGQVTDAWSAGVMFRGFEQLLRGRGSLDGLAITPRICGICTSAHLYAAALALDRIASARVPPRGIMIRNLALMAEHVQSDIRHALLMFCADFAHPVYQDHPLHQEAVERYQPLQGSSVLEAIRETQRMVETVHILGGKWPHSSFMTPGGLMNTPTRADLQQCQLRLRRYQRWYEQRILGCSMERWGEVGTPAELDSWLDESPDHASSELGFFLRFAREAGLERIGSSHGNFLSFGYLSIPEGSKVQGRTEGPDLIPAGFRLNGEQTGFDQQEISEHLSHSWFEGGPGGQHPFQGETRPYASGEEQGRYSWAKAPRFRNQPAETGPLAELLVAGHPLLQELVAQQGASVLVRQLARMVRPAELLPAMETWLKEAMEPGDYYRPPGPIPDGKGCGLIHAARGALGHWVEIRDERIVHYQIITPTAWNASPRDDADVRGPLEEAVLGTPVRDPSHPIEVGHVVRSFDPCLVCTVHSLGADGAPGPFSIRLP